MQREEVKENAVRLLAKLGEAHGAPGFEGAVRRIFREEVGDNPSTDKTGNIICEKKGATEKPAIMISGHMDEVGFVVQTILQNGLIKFFPLGGWWPHTLLAQRVRILTQTGTEIIGVVGAKPLHFLAESERDKVLKIDDMFIDVGASSADEATNSFGIRLGDSIVPYGSFTRMHNPDFLLSKAFDNRVGMALTIQVLQMLEGITHPNTVYGVGTVQEEVGVRGAQTAVSSVKPDAAIVLEGAPADDLPSIPVEERQGALGRGPQIRILDPSTIMHRNFTRHVINLAEANSISHQAAVRKSGGTDARAIHLQGEGVPTVVVSVPTRYIHTHNAIIHIEDYFNALELVLKLLESLNGDTLRSITEFRD
ncbi:MAG: M42 family metallopeptidase [Syntrophobacteraceae bacterium]